MSGLDLLEQIENMDDDLSACALMESEIYPTHSSIELLDMKEEIYFEEEHFEIEKKWCVVEFDDGVQLVPLQWISNGNWCHFPSYKSSARYEKAVQNYERSVSSWSIYAVKILGIYDLYDTAKDKLKAAEDGYDKESPEGVRRRKYLAQSVEPDNSGDSRRRRYSASTRTAPSTPAETVVERAPSVSPAITMERKHMNVEQKNLLMEFIKKHPELNSMKLSNNFTVKMGQELWEELATILNCVPGGCEKTWSQWRKTWHDVKCKAKAKSAALNSQLRTTGGGPTLSSTEKQVLEIVGETLVTAHSRKIESPAQFICNELNTHNKEIVESLQHTVKESNAASSTTFQELAFDPKADSSSEVPSTLGPAQGPSQRQKAPIDKTRKRKRPTDDAEAECKVCSLEVAKEDLKIKKEYYEFKKKILLENLELHKRNIAAKEKIADQLEVFNFNKIL